jgi:hypothetical protein
MYAELYTAYKIRDDDDRVLVLLFGLLSRLADLGDRPGRQCLQGHAKMPGQWPAVDGKEGGILRAQTADLAERGCSTDSR